MGAGVEGRLPFLKTDIAKWQELDKKGSFK